MEVICLQDEAFYALIDRVIERINDKQSSKTDKWLSGEEAMKTLRITSKTTLQKLRDEGKIPVLPDVPKGIRKCSKICL